MPETVTQYTARIAAELRANNPTWDAARIDGTARYLTQEALADLELVPEPEPTTMVGRLAGLLTGL